MRGQPLMLQYSHRKRARRLTKRQICGGTTVGYAGWGRETRSRVRRVAALVPAHRHALPCRRDDHTLTQHICTMAKVAQRLTSVLWASASAFGSMTAMSRLGDLFATLAEWGLDGLLNPAAAQAYDSELPRKHAEDKHDGHQLPGFCAMKGGIHWGSKCGKVHSCKEYISS